MSIQRTCMLCEVYIYKFRFLHLKEYIPTIRRYIYCFRDNVAAATKQRRSNIRDIFRGYFRKSRLSSKQLFPFFVVVMATSCPQSKIPPRVAPSCVKPHLTPSKLPSTQLSLRFSSFSTLMPSFLQLNPFFDDIALRSLAARSSENG